MMAITATVAAVAVTAGSTYYQGQQAKEAREKQADDQNAMMEEQYRLEDEAKQKADDQAAIDKETQRQQASLAKQGRGSTAGRAGTILTSPLGVTGSGSTRSGKTLLGG